MSPDFLQTDDVGGRMGQCELSPDLQEARLAEFGDVELQAPAVESDDVDFRRK